MWKGAGHATAPLLMICGYGRRREEEGENAHPSLVRFDVHLAVVATDDLAHEVQPQPQRDLPVIGTQPERQDSLEQQYRVPLAEATTTGDPES